MKKYITESAFIAIVMTISLFFAGLLSTYSAEKHLESSLVRLHILADSDSDKDQKIKLLVRDELLRRSEEIFRPYETSAEATGHLLENLRLIEKIAEEVMSENGCHKEAHAEIAEMEIDERNYGRYTVPDGRYTALRITLGSGQGQNWWCVMYPPLCVPCANAEMTDEEIMELYGGELTSDDIILLTQADEYKPKLYIIELIRKLLSKA